MCYYYTKNLHLNITINITIEYNKGNLHHGLFFLFDVVMQYLNKQQLCYDPDFLVK